MKNHLQFDFQVDKQNHRVYVKREFAAGLPLVWDAYTKSEILDQWWAPKPWKARTKTQDFREGGKWIYAMVGPEGEEHWAMVEYHSIEKLKSFSGNDAFANADGSINSELPQALWKIRFENEGMNTMVHTEIQYADLAQLETIIQMGFKEGFTLALEGLDEWLESNMQSRG